MASQLRKGRQRRAKTLPMHPWLLLSILLVTSSVVMSQENETAHKSPTDLMREIRVKVLTTPSSQMGRAPTTEYAHVDAIVMDWPIENTTISVMGSRVGDASIYTTGTFGLMGGIAFESVRFLAKDFVRLGEKYYSDAIPTKEYAYPENGRVRFYLVCDDGLRMIDRDAEALARRTDKYSDLFNQAQRVIAELRHIVDSQKNTTQ